MRLFTDPLWVVSAVIFVLVFTSLSMFVLSLEFGISYQRANENHELAM